MPEEDKKTGKIYMSKEKFRVYESYADSMADRSKFLAENHRYEKAGLYDAGVKGHLEKEAEAIAKAGYATDSNYAEKLIKIGTGRSVKGGIDLAEGRTPPSHEADHPHVLRKGDHGDPVGKLQTTLAALGYTDANGGSLKVDNDLAQVLITHSRHFSTITGFAKMVWRERPHLLRWLRPLRPKNR